MEKTNMQMIHQIASALLGVLRDPAWGALGVIISILSISKFPANSSPLKSSKKKLSGVIVSPNISFNTLFRTH